LFGTLSLPAWLAERVGSGGVAAQWERNTKQLLGLALTNQPSIEDARILPQKS